MLVDVREGERPRREVVVAALVDDLIGLSAYMDLGALNRLMQEGDVVNAAAIRVDPPLAASVYARFKHLGGIATVAEKRSWLVIFERTTATFVLFFSVILTVFAVAIAVGVVYNTARVALQEQAWELASCASSASRAPRCRCSSWLSPPSPSRSRSRPVPLSAGLPPGRS